MSRPFSVTMMALGVLTISIYHWARLVQALQQWQFLASLEMTAGPAYLAVTGLVFGLAGLVPALALWFGWSWAPRATVVYVSVLLVYIWADRLFLAVPAVRSADWPFALGVTLVVVAGMLLVFARPKIRAYFESKLEN